jgi:predicted aspartyl protease
MSLEFNPKEGLIVVPTRLFGPDGDIVVQLALDTGATGTLINWDIAMVIGYDPAVAKERVQITTGSGVEFAPRIRMAKIEALDKISENFDIICHTLPPGATVDGLLGLDFFRGNIISIDMIKGLLKID